MKLPNFRIRELLLVTVIKLTNFRIRELLLVTVIKLPNFRIRELLLVAVMKIQELANWRMVARGSDENTGIGELENGCGTFCNS